MNNDSIKLASKYGYADIVKLLIADPRVDPTDDDNTAIKEASSNGHTRIVELLKADPRISWKDE